ncbi:MAG: hypothetical protein ACRCZS_02170 [Chroococcidiopsis sp.]
MLQLDPAAIAQLDRTLTNAYHATVEAIHDEAIRQIEEPLWRWGRYTKRKNGTIVGSPRNIKDTGELLRAQTLEYNSNDSVDLVNTADHAIAVALGHRSGKTTVPGRNWMRAAVNNLNPEQIFLDQWERRS